MKFWTLGCCAFAIAFSIPQARAWEVKPAPLMTPWAAAVDTNAPLPEYPRPQMVRSDWLNLNGLWQFQAGDTNEIAPAGHDLAETILVPFPMESPLSGIKVYHPDSWYRRTFTVPAAWQGKHIILHLDAVSWESEVFINGTSAGVHQGGYDPISYDITPLLKGDGPQELIVRAYAPVDAAGEPRGKQTLQPQGIMYTSSSGIWQPVWLEPVSDFGISSLKIIPDVDHQQLRITVNTLSNSAVSVAVAVSSNGVPVKASAGTANTEFAVPIPSARLWSPADPFLYDLKVTATAKNGADDTVTSYFGMRKISVGTVDGIKKMLLNDKFVFQLGPLDQGFWPDGNYTAPTDAALRSDIEAE
jgi:beta-galactosidase/beta-glucuronidase